MRVERTKATAAALFLALSLFFGGASGAGAGVAANAFLQVIAVLILLFCAWTANGVRWSWAGISMAMIFAGFCLIALSYLIPLPSELWTNLPGRDTVVSGLVLINAELADAPTSLTPLQTLDSILWALPPAAMFVVVLQLPHSQRRLLPWVLLVIAVLSIVLGGAQLAGGTASPLRFYRVTNEGLPVGFFANINHQVTFLLCSLALAGYLAARAAARSARGAQKASAMTIALAIGAFILVGVAISGSIAGYGLVIPVALASFLIYRRSAHGLLGRKWIVLFAVLFSVFFTAVLLLPFTEDVLAEKLGSAPASRRVIWATTFTAIGQYFPVGSGLGSFVSVFRTVDDPDRLVGTYVNHAHNDYLELTLELGLWGIVIVLAFLVWWVARALHFWKSNEEGANLARSATIVIGIVLVHSLVDYPIRTSAIAVVFALACAYLVPPIPPAHRVDHGNSKVRKDRHSGVV